MALTALPLVYYQHCSYGGFEKEHDMGCTTQKSAVCTYSPLGSILLAWRLSCGTRDLLCPAATEERIERRDSGVAVGRTIRAIYWRNSCDERRNPMFPYSDPVGTGLLLASNALEAYRLAVRDQDHRFGQLPNSAYVDRDAFLE